MFNSVNDLLYGLQMLWEDTKLYVVFFLLGGGGGVSFHLMRNRSLLSAPAMRAACVSAFMGFLAGTGSDYLGVSMQVRYFLAGTAGFFGGSWVLVVAITIAERLGIDLSSSLDKAAGINETLGDFSDQPKNREAQVHLYGMLDSGLVSAQEYVDIIRGAIDPIDLLAVGRLTKEQYKLIMDIEPPRC